MARGLEAPLSTNEEITLRRVAYGQSDATLLRGQDLERLRVLKLIVGSARAPTLTPEGKQRFDRLAKPAALASFNVENEMMATIGRMMARKPDR